MNNLADMLVLLVLAAIVGLWLKLSAARERAVQEARRQCQQHGLQLLFVLFLDLRHLLVVHLSRDG